MKQKKMEWQIAGKRLKREGEKIKTMRESEVYDITPEQLVGGVLPCHSYFYYLSFFGARRNHHNLSWWWKSVRVFTVFLHYIYFLHNSFGGLLLNLLLLDNVTKHFAYNTCFYLLIASKGKGLVLHSLLIKSNTCTAVKNSCIILKCLFWTLLIASSSFS